MVASVIERVRGRTLQRRRHRYFSRNPLCAECLRQERTTLACILDHVKPLHQGGTDDESNWQGLCVECNLRKSKLERGHRYVKRTRTGLDGYPMVLLEDQQGGGA